MKKVLTVILTAIMLLGIMAIPMSAAWQREVRVSTPEELLAALASNTKIILAPGKYVLEAKDEVLHFDNGESWNYKVPVTLAITELNNVTLEGNGQAEVVLDVGFAPVIDVDNSTNITINGLILGHAVPEYGCEGEGFVIRVSRSNNVTVNNCDLYGCGVNGIYAWESGNITVNNSVIRDCMVNAAEAQNMKGNLTFNDCKFLRNAYDKYYSQYVACIKFDINPEYGGYGNLYVNRCVFEGNLSTEFVESISYHDGTNEEWEAFINNCTFSGNVWETAIKVKIADEDYTFNCYFEDQGPVIVEGRTLIPVRGVLESLGYEVSWDDATKSVILKDYYGSEEMKISIGSDTIYKNGEAIKIDVPATIINGRTMIPVRAIVEAFGYEISWNEAKRAVIIYRQ